MRLTPSPPRLGAVLMAALMVLAGGCAAPRDSIVLEEGLLSIENQTDYEWRSVRVTINDHFSGGAPTLAAGGRLTAQLSQFQTGFGQKFDRARQSVYKIEVTATSADGKPVTLQWGTDQPR
jgi:hypothetical protein